MLAKSGVIIVNELETLFPHPQEAIVGDEIIEITPLKIGEIPKLLKALKGVSLPMDGQGNLNVLGLLSGEHGESVLDAVAIAVRKPRAWLDDLPADEALELAFAVVEANVDFFVRRILPLIEAEMEQVTRRLGQTASSASSPTATPGEMSPATP